MARTLDSRYFRLLERRIEGPFEYQSYQTVRPTSTMVLFSKTQPNSPIAALSFFPRSRGTNAKTVLTRREAPPDVASDGYSFFQGLSNIDNDEFAFAIHNLTDFVREPHVNIRTSANKDKIGYLKIDILGHKTEVREVDLPTIGINQVNELRPSESYLIQSDQRTGNSTMVLRGTVDEQTGRRVTVRQDEAAAGGALNEKTKGTYFYISVVASANFPAMVDLMRETTWRAVDVFVRRVPKDNGRTPEYRSRGGDDVLLMDSTRPRGGAYAATLAYECEYEDDETCGVGVRIGGSSRTKGASSGGGAFATTSVAHGTSPLLFQSASSVPTGEYVSATPTGDEIQGSQAGQVVKGSQTISVSTDWTGQRYAYDLPGERVCFGLSVWRDMRLLETLTHEEARQEAQMQLKDAVENHGRALLELLSKVFKQEECTICLANAPDVIFFQCGHQCLCQDCSNGSPQAQQEKRCYMCRAPIAARIPASIVAV